MSDAKLKAFIDRVLRSREREDAEKENTKQIYKELAGEGYDKTVVGKVVNFLRKDQDKAREQSEQFDLYLAAYLGASHVHARAREAAETSSHAGPSVPVRQPSFAGTGGEADRQPIPEPVVGQTADPLRSGAATRDADLLAQAPTNILQLRKHNPETHFLNSAGLERLHGCQRPDACAGSWRGLCHGCAPKETGEVA